MESKEFDVPIAFIVFNRLEPVKQVFQVIKQVKPSKLYVISDAARDSKAGEKEKVNLVRQYIEEHIDWDCEVNKNYATENMGCRERIISGITWCFEKEEELIILEDDCLPDVSFFGFAKQMLSVYKDDPRVMHIGGFNAEGKSNTKEDYVFSQRPCAWGWATWRRAWDKYDVNMPTWPAVRDSGVLKWRFANKYAYEDRVKEWDDIYYHNIDAWGYAWDYALMINNAYAVYPAVNLVQNIGFGEEATHTVEKNGKPLGDLNSITLPVKIRTDFLQDYDYDKSQMKYSFWIKIKRHIRKTLPEGFWKKYYDIRYNKTKVF